MKGRATAKCPLCIALRREVRLCERALRVQRTVLQHKIDTQQRYLGQRDRAVILLQRLLRLHHSDFESDVAHALRREVEALIKATSDPGGCT
jgi:hypothetical protein